MFSKHGKLLWSAVYTNTYCFGTGINTLMSISFLDKARKLSVDRWKRRGLWGKSWMKMSFFSCQSRHFLCVVNINKLMFPIFNWTLRVNFYFFSAKENVKIGETRLLKGKNLLSLLIISWLSRLILVIMGKDHILLYSWVCVKMQNNSVFTTVEYFFFNR